MEVVAFVGPSGTGKSHRALSVAHDNKSEAIIDDGLLIKGTKILAGSSAKSEQNRIQAVKRAIFSDQEHVDEDTKRYAEWRDVYGRRRRWHPRERRQHLVSRAYRSG